MFSVQNRKSEHLHSIKYIRINLNTKIYLKQTVLIFFWSNLPKEGYYQSKVQQMNITIEINIFQLAHLPNFIWKRQFSCFGPNLAKMGIISRKPDKWTSPPNSVYSNGVGANFHLKQTILMFLNQICPKKVFSAQNRKSEYHYSIHHIRLILLTKFNLKQIILSFWNKFAQKGYF